MDCAGETGLISIAAAPGNVLSHAVVGLCFTIMSVVIGSVTASVRAAVPDGAALPTVVSINLCADQLVLALADDQQIASLTNLSHEEAGSYYFKQARNYATNTGKAGEVILFEPDFVIAGEYSNRYTVRALQSAGLQVELLPIASSVEAMLTNLQQVADWLGQRERGVDLVNSLRGRLNALEAPEDKPLRAAVYDPNGYTVGSQSLRGDVLQRAGWHNIAKDVGISSYGTLPLETLMRLQPDVLIESPYSPGTFSRAQQLNQHPVLTQSGLAPGIITVPSAQTICGGPWTVDLIERLVAERLIYESAKSHVSR